MDRTLAVERVNAALGSALLNRGNTAFSNVNAAKPARWFNIDPRKFRNDLHLLCARNTTPIWLKIAANAIPNPERMFRFRCDKGMVDLELCCSFDRYMRDVKSGGNGYDFRPHVQREWS